MNHHILKCLPILCLCAAAGFFSACATTAPSKPGVSPAMKSNREARPETFPAGTRLSDVMEAFPDEIFRKSPKQPENAQEIIYFLPAGNFRAVYDATQSPPVLTEDSAFRTLNGSPRERLKSWTALWSM